MRQIRVPRPGSAWAGWLIVAIGLLGLCVCLPCPSQETESVGASPRPRTKGPTGIVTGTIYCADTNAPARLAQVFLLPESGDSTFVSQTTSTVELAGHFALGNVPEGKYYVSVKQSGYLDPIATLKTKKLDSMTPEARKEIEKHLVVVSVSSKQPADLSVRLERAAEIDGMVLYDDGSPAVGLHVELKQTFELGDDAQLHREYASVADFGEESTRTTDDHGRYRILGVSPGEYAVSVTVPTVSGEGATGNPLMSVLQSSPVGALIVYYGDIFRASKAKPVKIETSGSTATADITIPLSKLHTIRGRVMLKSNGEPPLAGGVVLQYADTHENARVGIFAGGEFAIFYVPEGNYTLAAAASPEALPNFDEEDGGAAWSFSPAGFGVRMDSKLPDDLAPIPLLVIGDMTDITLTAANPPPAPAKQVANPEAPENPALPSPPPQ